ncbi:MAG: DMT family transporter [Elusimicrobia bacterium]|nr:DMT family transporter [Elusimicrobiota bacterium]
MTYFKVLFTVLFWGGAFALAKRALTEVSPVTLVMLRCFLGSAVMLLFAGDIRWIKKVSAQEWRRIIIAGLLGILGQQLIQAYGLLHTSANHAGWIIGLVPIAVAVILKFMFKEKLGSLRGLGFALGFAGTAMVVFSRQSGAGASIIPTGFGDFLFIVSCFNWAMYVIMTGKWFKSITQDKVSVLGMLISFFAMFLWSFLGGYLPETLHVSARGWVYILLLGVVSSGVCYSFWNASVEKLGAHKASAFLYLEPLSALITSVLLLGEIISPYSIAGGFLILAGVYVVNSGTTMQIFKKFFSGEPG